MSFLHPEFLYYMLPPLFVLFGLLLTQKETQAHFFSEDVMSKLRVSANTLTLKARNALFFLMAVFMVVALAQPVIKDGEVEVKAKSADIMIALDISDSMLAEDVYPNRLKMAKQKAIELLNMAVSERIGVIAFAKNSYLVSPLSFDHGAVSFLLSQLNTDSITEKGTDFISMLDVVNKSLTKHNKKYLLVLSDGGDEHDFSKEIALAKEHGIVVFVLGIGTAKGAPIKLKNGSFIKQHGEIIVSKLNENISELATKTGGVYIEYTNSNEDIKAMLREIEKVSEKKELKSEKVQRYIPLFYFPLGMALLLLLIATSSMSKRESVSLPSAFLLFALVFTNTQSLQAGVLDFMELSEAKKAYKEQNYAKASKLYEQYAQRTHNGESYYNAGNAYYKEKNYKKAIEAYEKATFDNKEQRAQNFANLGNAYAKTGDMKNLQKAIEVYEKSLKIKEDAAVKENLETVKKLIKEQEQKNQNKDSKNSDKQNKDNKDSDSKENKDSDSKEKDAQNKDKSNKDQQNKSQDEKNKENESKEKNSKDKQSDSQNKDEKNKDKSEQNSGEKAQDNKKNKSDKQAPQNENNKTKEKQKKKPDLKQLSKDEPKDKEKNDKQKNQDASSASSVASKEMSDAEEAKWLKQLNLQQSTYLYMLNDQRPREEKTNEKPW